MYLGIDGCKAGWIVACIDQASQLNFYCINELSGLYHFETPESIWIDMPMHFARSGYRSSEIEARKLLGKRRSSVFFTPCAQAVYAHSFAEACAINQKHCGKKISIQVWNICNKIRAVNSFALNNPGLKISESHPELCFYGLNNATPCVHNKKTAEGRAERLQIIERVSKQFAKAIAQAAFKGSSKDDVVDAAVLAVAAWSGNHDYLPKTHAADEGGQIVFARLNAGV